jgi:hypothetical protein
VVSTLTSLGIATYFPATRWSEEALYESFVASDFSTEHARSRAVSELELELKLKAEESRRGRDIAAWIVLIGGVINATQGGVLLTQDLLGDRSLRVAAPGALLIGLGQVLFGLYLKASSTALERAWETYAADPAVQQRQDP